MILKKLREEVSVLEAQENKESKPMVRILPAIIFIRDAKRGKDEDFAEYKLGMKIMKKAQKAIECYGATEATLTCLFDKPDGGVVKVIQYGRRGIDYADN